MTGSAGRIMQDLIVCQARSLIVRKRTAFVSALQRAPLCARVYAGCGRLLLPRAGRFSVASRISSMPALLKPLKSRAEARFNAVVGPVPPRMNAGAKGNLLKQANRSGKTQKSVIMELHPKKVYLLQTLQRGQFYHIARSQEHDPVRILMFYEITEDWVRRHFPQVEESEYRAWLGQTDPNRST